MIHPSLHTKSQLRRTASIDGALMAAGIMGQREIVPKRIRTERTINGQNPAADIAVVSSNPVPLGKCFALTSMVEELAYYSATNQVLYDIVPSVTVCADQQVIYCGSLRNNGPTWTGGAITMDREKTQNVYPLDYLVAEDTIISLVTFFQYTGGDPVPANTTAIYTVELTGYIIDEPCRVGRGARNPPVVTTVLQYVALANSARL